MSRLRFLPPAFTLLLLAACGFDPGDESPMAPPAVYREWWGKTEACSGLTGDFGRVSWSVVVGPSFPCSSGRCAGHWEPGHRIYLAEGWAMNEMVVRHEILHELMNGGGHPNPPFGQGCPLTWETWPAGAEPRVTATTRPHLD